MYWHFLPIFSQSGSSPAQRNSNEYNFGCPRDDYDAADLELARLSYILAKCQSASHLKVPFNYTSPPSPYSTPTTNTTTLTSATTIPAVASSTFQRLPSAFSLSSGGEAAHASAAALNQEAPQSRKRRLPQAPQIGGWAAGMMLRSSKSEQNLVSSASAAFSDR